MMMRNTVTLSTNLMCAESTIITSFASFFFDSFSWYNCTAYLYDLASGQNSELFFGDFGDFKLESELLLDSLIIMTSSSPLSSFEGVFDFGERKGSELEFFLVLGVCSFLVDFGDVELELSFLLFSGVSRSSGADFDLVGDFRPLSLDFLDLLLPSLLFLIFPGVLVDFSTFFSFPELCPGFLD